ncbi:MAG: hypothetical protein U1E39_15005 [Planctomycetota bacterium]
MSLASALTGGLLPVVARFDPDDWGLIVFFLIAGLIRLVDMIRGKAKRAPRAEEPAPAPKPPPRAEPAPDPWRRAPAPPPAPVERAPARPAPRPVTHDVEGPDHTLVELGAWKPHEFESERKAKDKASGKPRAKAPPPPPRDARPAAGRALLVGNLTTPRDRMRAAVVWKEVLDRPRRLPLRRPPSRPQP